jgi:hypothetical protein
MDLSKSAQVGKYARKKKEKALIPEKFIQKQAEEYLKYIDCEIIRIPDEVYMVIYKNPKIPVYIKKIIADYIKSIPDLTVLFPDGKYHCVELKSKTGKLTSGQKRFKNRVGEVNYSVCRSIEDFVKLIQEFKNSNYLEVNNA